MKKTLKQIGRVLLKSLMWFFIISFTWVLLYRWVDPPITFLQIREWKNCPENREFQKEWKDLEDISFHMHLAVVASEDQHFMKHNGIDFGAIEKAVKHNETHKKKRGASTISQQTAKNVFLWPNRSWLRKGFEVYFTLLMELLWPKERILEVYLNVIETGQCTFGVEAASQKYFNKSASKLTKSQAALLAAALPSPRKSNPRNPSAYLNSRKNHVIKQMNLIGKNYFKRYGAEDWPNTP